MIPKLVTFDCAQTLVKVPVNWSMGAFAADCARHIGMSPSDEDAGVYQRLYIERLPEFFAVNRSRDKSRAEAFWKQLATDWLNAIGQSAELVFPLSEASEHLGFGPNSILFQLYDDVVECLDMLDAMGVKAAIVSNWDYSIHRVLGMFGIYERFVVVKASLEEGVEKPDPRLFQIALSEAGFAPEDTFHIGDSHEDDYEGAVAAGIRVALIDRELVDPKKPYIRSLLDLPEAFAWTD